MHVLLVTSAARIEHEGPMLAQLSDGLVASGHELTRIIPAPPDADPIDLPPTRPRRERVLPITMQGLPWVRRARARRLAENLTRPRPDVLLACGTAAWPIAVELARSLERPAVLEVFSGQQVRLAPRGRAAAAVAAYITPTHALARALRARVGPDLVAVALPGVELPAQPRPVLEHPEQAVALAAIGAGRDLVSYGAWLDGLAQVVSRRPQLQAFVELPEAGEDAVWRQLTRLNLHGAVSMIGAAERVRDLLVRCDALVVPEPSGVVRGLVLEAMAGGVPVLAAFDPMLDELLGPEGPARERDPGPTWWAAAIDNLVARPSEARSRGLDGRRRISERHRPADHLEVVVATLERARTGGTYAFRPAGT